MPTLPLTGNHLPLSGNKPLRSTLSAATPLPATLTLGRRFQLACVPAGAQAGRLPSIWLCWGGVL